MIRSTIDQVVSVCFKPHQIQFTNVPIVLIHLLNVSMHDFEGDKFIVGG
jgi:hypothetical protein